MRTHPVAAFLILTLWLVRPAAADFAAGVAAYDRGEYAAAYEAWLPLARGGDPAAQRNIGHLHRFGLGVAQDFERAAYWYREAAESGLAGAQTNLAVMYLRGQGLAEDPKRAAYWFKLAASQGHAVAQYNLGLLHLTGNGVPRSEPHALGWFHLAARAGHKQALEALSKLVLESATLVGPPPPPGWKPPDAEAETGTRAAGENAAVKNNGPSDKPAPAAPADEPPPVDVFAALGRLFSDPDGTPQPTAAAPASAGSRSLDEVSAEAEQPVSTAYIRTPDDQQQLTAAMVAFHAGDHEVARAQLEPLALRGMVEAQYWLGLLHARPEFEAGDRAEAYVWLSLAADGGHPEAARARSGLMERMNSEERLRSHALLQARRGRS